MTNELMLKLFFTFLIMYLFCGYFSIAAKDRWRESGLENKYYKIHIILSFIATLSMIAMPINLLLAIWFVT